MKKIIRALLAVVALSLLVTVLCVFASADTSKDGEGLSFTASSAYTVSETTETQPLTFEARVALPTSFPSATRGGAVISNYKNGKTKGYSFEISTNGNPRLYILYEGNKNTNLTFKTDIRTDAAEGKHIAVVIDKENNLAHLYVDGVLAESAAPTVNFNTAITDSLVTPNPYMIGGDYRSGNTIFFNGRILSAALYSDIRTAEEIKSDAAATVGGDNCMFAYDFTSIAPFHDLSGNGRDLNFPDDYGFQPTSKLNKLGSQFKSAPLAIESWVYLPDSTAIADSARMGVIFGNYVDGNCLNFEIINNGQPRLYVKTTNTASNVTNILFTDPSGTALDFRLGRWAHVAFVKENDAVVLYLDGEEVSRMSCPYEFERSIVTNGFVLGGDNRAENTKYFKGKILDVAVYSAPRTAAQIKSDMLRIDNSDSTLMAHFHTDKVENPDFIEDLSSNKNHIAPVWFDSNPNAPTDYAYSFAIVGDTQFLVEKDAESGTSYTSYIYDWILKNKDTKNIQYVLGLGDITENDYDAEWVVAKEQITKLDGKIPYSLVTGISPHDKPATFNKYFADHEAYTDTIDGTYTYGEYHNSYRIITVGGIKYLIFTLEFGATDPVLDWAADLITANLDCRVIITTHCFLHNDGTLAGTEGQNHSALPTGAKNDGVEMWDKLISKHPNIYLVISGHYATEDPLVKTFTGDYGNTVTALLVDPQEMDTAQKYETGMVAMLYFSEDGNTVDVEYISTYREQYFKLDNQFSLTLADKDDYVHQNYVPDPEKLPAGAVVTKYGLIPAGEYTDAEAYPFAIFAPNANSATGYTFQKGCASLYARVIDGKEIVGSASCAMHQLRSNKGGVILMRADSTYDGTARYTNLSYHNHGAAAPGILDLGGHTLTDLHETACGIFDWYIKSNTSTYTDVALSVRNGSILLKNNPLVEFENNLASATSTISFERVNVSFAEGAAVPAVIKVTKNKDSISYASFTNCTVDYANAPEGIEIFENSSCGTKLKLTLTQTTILDRDNYLVGTNMTLADRFMVNLYIPKDPKNSKQETEYYRIFNENYTVADLETVTVDGKECYKVAVPLMPHELGETFTIKIYARRIYTFYDPTQAENKAQKTNVRTMTELNVDPIGYLERLTARNNEALTTLVKDILSYARSAYAYAGITAYESVAARIDQIIGEDYDSSSVPAFAQTALDTDGLDSARLSIGSSPAFIFYPETLDSGAPIYDPSLYTFTVKGYRVKAEQKTDEDGKVYFLVKTFAYAFDDTIEYTVAGTDISGSYNLSAYYEFAKGLDDASLVKMLERLCKYAESAEAYANAQKGA